MTNGDCIERNAALPEFIKEYGDDDFTTGYNWAVDEYRQKISEIPAVNRWISCSDRLPKNRERVLVCFRSGTVHIAVWYGDYDEKGAWKVTSQFPTKLYRTDTIPKWMPMPDAYEPPESEVKDDDEIRD